jgi:uncharacterized membrane protein YfcA
MPVYAFGEIQGLVRNLSLIGAATTGVVIGTLIGTPLLKRFPEQWFRRTVAFLLIALGVYMLNRAVSG